jgi:hypothetical protein
MQDDKIQTGLKRDLSLDEAKHSQYQELAENDIFKNSDAPTRYVFLYAMALGYNNNNPVPLRKKKGVIPTRTLSEAQLWLINSIAIAKKGSVEVLFDANDILNIAEEYANGGVQDLYEVVIRRPTYDAYKIMDDEASQCVRTQFKENRYLENIDWNRI